MADLMVVRMAFLSVDKKVVMMAWSRVYGRVLLLAALMVEWWAD